LGEPLTPSFTDRRGAGQLPHLEGVEMLSVGELPFLPPPFSVASARSALLCLSSIVSSPPLPVLLYPASSTPKTWSATSTQSTNSGAATASVALNTVDMNCVSPRSRATRWPVEQLCTRHVALRFQRIVGLCSLAARVHFGSAVKSTVSAWNPRSCTPPPQLRSTRLVFRLLLLAWLVIPVPGLVLRALFLLCLLPWKRSYAHVVLPDPCGLLAVATSGLSSSLWFLVVSVGSPACFPVLLVPCLLLRKRT
jgi:hypothetical protein